MDSSTIASIIIAIIAALASTVSLYFTYYTTRRSEERAMQTEIKKQLNKYSQPLLIAAFDFQARLYDLVDRPISSRALECEEGREDVYRFTCYLLARFLASAYILRETTHFLSIRSESKDSTTSRLSRQKEAPQEPEKRPIDDEEKKTTDSPRSKPSAPTPHNLAVDENASILRDLLYKIDDELDRRRDETGTNYGVFPSSRLLISERMLIRSDRPDPSASSSDTSPSSSNAPSDSSIQIKDWNTFLSEWDRSFKSPCTWFTNWLETLISHRQSGILRKPTKSKARREHGRRQDDHLRCLQHLLCDLVTYCDLRGLYNDQGAGAYPRCSRSLDCDCWSCGYKEVGERHESRMGDGDL